MRILSGIAVAFCFAAIAVHPIRAQQGQASPLSKSLQSKHHDKL